jgi:hypothetical protein
MLMSATIELNIPSEIYDRAQQIARDSNRSVETVMLDALGLLFSASIAEIEPNTLHVYSDEQLWAIVYQRLTWPQETRLRELIALGKAGIRSSAEAAEAEQLIDLVDRHMLLRSEAILILTERGYDVKTILNLG